MAVQGDDGRQQKVHVIAGVAQPVARGAQVAAAGAGHGAGLLVPVAQIAQRHIPVRRQLVALPAQAPVLLLPPEQIVLILVALLKGVFHAQRAFVRRDGVEQIDAGHAVGVDARFDEADQRLAGLVRQPGPGGGGHLVQHALRDHEVGQGLGTLPRQAGHQAPRPNLPATRSSRPGQVPVAFQV